MSATLVPSSSAQAGISGRLDTGVEAAWVLLGAMACSLALALSVPLASAVIALIVCGVWHNLAEFRFLARQGLGAVGERRVLQPLLAMFGGIALVRLLAVMGMIGNGTSRQWEIALGYCALGGLACWLVPRQRLALALLPLMGLAAWWSWTHPALHFVGLAQLHNVIPALLLIGWSRGPRGSSAGLHLAWSVVIPALLLLGAFDPLAASDPQLGATIAGSWTDFVRGYVPSDWLGTPLALRGLMVFAYLQLMHYFLWIIWIPRYSDTLSLPPTPVETPFAAALLSRKTLIIGGIAAVAIGALMAFDFLLGRGLYASLASIHAYLEFPILLLLVMGVGCPPTPRRGN